jgi:hypothetical protein
MATIDSITNSFNITALRSGFADIAVYVIWGVVILAVVVVAWMKYQDKKIFIYPVRVFRQRNNGIVKELNYFGGYVKKGKITEFVVKLGRIKKKTMNKLPNSEFMDEDNRVYYWQLSPDSPYIQVRRKFDMEEILIPNEEFIEPSEEDMQNKVELLVKDLKLQEEFKDITDEEDLKTIAFNMIKAELFEEKNKMIDVTIPSYTPIPTDLKQQAMVDIAYYKQILGVDANKQFAYFIMGVIALVILGTIIFYIAVNKGDVPILTKFVPLLLLGKNIKK